MNRMVRGLAGERSPVNDSPLRRAFPSEFQPDDSPLDATGLILAGGASRRMGGRNKAFLELGGRPLIALVIERMHGVCAEVPVVAGNANLIRQKQG
jgi:hypothetical protein